MNQKNQIKIKLQSLINFQFYSFWDHRHYIQPSTELSKGGLWEAGAILEELLHTYNWGMVLSAPM